jgi:hypothetical protein
MAAPDNSVNPARSRRAAAAAVVDLHEGPGLGGQARDLAGVQLSVAEEHRPAHLGQLPHAHLAGSAGTVGVQP